MRATTIARLTWLMAAGLLAGCGRQADEPPGADWPLFRGSPERLGSDGVSALPGKPPVVAWVFNEAKPVTFWSSPLVRGRRLYVGGGVLSPFGTRGYVYCLDPEQIDPATKKPRVIWRHRVAKLVFSSPALAGGIVVCGEGTHTDTGARLYALRADADEPEGRRIWDFPVAGTIEASPCVADRSVFFGTGDDFHCLDLHTGRARWKATVVDVLSAPVAADGVVYVGSGRGEQARTESRQPHGRELLALDAATGKVRWRTQLSYPCSAPITYSAGRLIAGTGRGTFVLSDGSRPAGEVVCHDAATGRQLWSRPLPDNVLAAIPVQSGMAHVACRNGRYHLLSLSDGRALWDYSCRAALLASPVVSGDRVLLVDCRGMAHCLDFRNKTLLWRLDLPRRAGLGRTSEAFSSPILVGGRIYVGLGSLGLICLQPSGTSRDDAARRFQP